MAARQRQHTPGAALLVVISALLLARAATGQGEPNPQGSLVYGMGKWLTADDTTTLGSWGWNDGGNPCLGWIGVTCNAEGYVSSIDLPNKGLKGSLPTDPSLWAGLTGLTSINLSGNSLGGSVPQAISAAGPQLTSINVAGNPAMCGGSPAGVVGDAMLAAPCAPADAANATTTTPLVVDAANATVPVVNATVEAPVTPANGTAPLPAPAPTDNTTAAVPSTTATATAPSAAAASPSPAAVPSPSPSPSPSPVIIKNAPICSCALKGFGSEDCATAVANKCAGSSPPPMCGMGDVSKDDRAANELGSFLAGECFTGQSMDTSICTCVQNLLGNDCAKARVGLCVKQDPLCLPFQNIIDSNGSSNADAVNAVAPFLDENCPVAEPKLPGVKATMEFPDLSMGQYITRQYTQNVANALSSVTAVPSTSISTLDVRPFLSSSGGRRRARALLHHTNSAAGGSLRLLLQTSGNGVQATYFLQTDDPAGVSQKLSTAAGDGTLSTKLSQYGITAQAGGLKVQSFLPPPPPPASSGSSGSSGFPLWALAPIIIGSLLLLGVLGLLIWCCCFRKKARKDRKAKKGTAAPVKAAPVVGGAAVGGAAIAAAAHSDSSRDRDTLPKTYDYAPAPVNTVYTGSFGNASAPAAAAKTPGSGISPAAAALGVGAAAAAAGTGAVALSKPGSQKSSAAGDLPVSRSMRVASPDAAYTAGPALHSDGSAGGLAATNSSTLTPWESGAAAGEVPRAAAAPVPASSPATLSHLTSLAPVRTSMAGTASSGGASTGALAAGALGAGALAAAGTGAAVASHNSSGGSSLQPQDSAGSAWKSNVRPTSGAMAGGVAATSSMAGGKSTQQAERAKFWAQFQETWQQVRQNQNMNDEPGTPSSGTNWTDNTGAVSPRK